MIRARRSVSDARSKILIVAVLMALIAGCAAPDDPTTSGDGDAESPGTTTSEVETTEPAGVDDGSEELVVRIAVHEDPDTLESHMAYSAFHSTVLRNIYEPLLGRHPTTGELVPRLAVAWEQVEPTRWRFDLREGVTFHDGSEFNAEVAAYGLEFTWAEDNMFTIRQFMGTSMTFEAVDDYTLDVITGAPDALLPVRLYMSVIPSMQQLESDADSYSTHPVGTGPYRFVSWERGSTIELEVNDDWWGFDAPDSVNQPEYDRAIFLIRPEPASRIAALRAGEVSLAERLPPDACLGELGDQCIQAPQSDVVFIKVDTPSPVLGDSRVREAISLAIDRATIGQTILGGAEPASMLVGSNALGYHDGLSPDPYDLDRAIGLIEEAIADGVPVASTPLRLLTRQGSFPGNTQVLEVVLDSLQRIGLTNIEAEVQEPSIFNAVWLTHLSDITSDRGVIALHKHTNEWFDFGPTINSYYSCAATASVFCSEEVEDLYSEARQMGIESERAAVYRQIAEIGHEDRSNIPIANQLLFHGVALGFSWNPRPDMLVLLEDMKAD